MTKISAKIVADSISAQGHRITTMELVFPRFILAELNTHRLFSKNSASSRAIPFEKMLKEVQENPFIPIAWQKDHKGMQGTEYLGEVNTRIANSKWLQARDNAVESAKTMNSDLHVNITKQLCNRLLEPFVWHKVLLTATEFHNFFELRCSKYPYHDKSGNTRFHKSKSEWSENYSWNLSGSEGEDFGKSIQDPPKTDLDWLKFNEGQAEIHMRELAECMYDVMRKSSPKLLEAGEWHIPYVDSEQSDEQTILLGFASGDYLSKTGIKLDYEKACLMVSSARCARLSYQTLGDDAKIDFSKDLTLHDNLLQSKHMSPFEHCAKAMNNQEYETNVKGVLFDYSSTMEGYQPGVDSLGWCRNFRGFIQYRETLENK